jgi:hypothetical protein
MAITQQHFLIFMTYPQKLDGEGQKPLLMVG